MLNQITGTCMRNIFQHVGRGLLHFATTHWKSYNLQDLWKGIYFKKCFWRHRKYHKEGQKCQCPICLQWFISQTLLNVHMQNHQDQKTFDWQVGGKTLASKQSFVFHQETHVRVTSNIFKCSLCPKDFPDERRLTVHKHTHSRNRESCALCTMNYPNKASLKKHKDAKHRKITFLCEICNLKFSSMGKPQKPPENP